MRSMEKAAVLALSLTLMSGMLHAFGQQSPPEPHRHPGNFAKIEQLVHDIQANAASDSSEKIRAFGYIMANLKWAQNKPITVCFIDPSVPNATSSASTKSRIVELMRHWVRPGYANLTLDFGPEGSWRRCSNGTTADIRIGFDPNSPNGPNWSYVGHDTTISPMDATANFYFSADVVTATDGNPLAYYLPYTILHETGHALGFIHEHQGGNCDGEFNFQNLYQYYGWTPAMIDANFRHLYDPNIKQVTPYCRGSIMNYVVDTAYYIKGAASACYTPPVSELADCDQKTAQVAYPDPGVTRVQAAVQLNSMILTATGDAPASEQERHILLSSATEVGEKAGLPAEIIASLQKARATSDIKNSPDLQAARLALGKVVNGTRVQRGPVRLAQASLWGYLVLSNKRRSWTSLKRSERVLIKRAPRRVSRALSAWLLRER